MIFSESEPVFTSAVPAGGSQITGRHLRVMLSIPIDAAERSTKRSLGAAWSDAIDPDETSPSCRALDAREPVELERRKLVSIVPAVAWKKFSRWSMNKSSRMD